GHPLHMHGHYFMVDAMGDGRRWTPLAASRRRRVVTEVLQSGASLALSWMPERAGNWLFHCHIIFHVAPELRLTPDSHGGHEAHDKQHMAGLVLGMTVTQAKPAALSSLEPHRLRLVAGQRVEGGLHGDTALGYQLAEVGSSAPVAPRGFSSPG